VEVVGAYLKYYHSICMKPLKPKSEQSTSGPKFEAGVLLGTETLGFKDRLLYKAWS